METWPIPQKPPVSLAEQTERNKPSPASTKDTPNRPPSGARGLAEVCWAADYWWPRLPSDCWKKPGATAAGRAPPDRSGSTHFGLIHL